MCVDVFVEEDICDVDILCDEGESCIMDVCGVYYCAVDEFVDDEGGIIIDEGGIRGRGGGSAADFADSGLFGAGRGVRVPYDLGGLNLVRRGDPFLLLDPRCFFFCIMLFLVLWHFCSNDRYCWSSLVRIFIFYLFVFF